jgi:hypothetical protein
METWQAPCTCVQRGSRTLVRPVRAAVTAAVMQYIAKVLGSRVEGAKNVPAQVARNTVRYEAVAQPHSECTALHSTSVPAPFQQGTSTLPVMLHAAHIQLVHRHRPLSAHLIIRASSNQETHARAPLE